MKMNKKGFTLIEMLVVIAIIAILVAIVVPTVTSATNKAACATNAANMRSVAAEVGIAMLTHNTQTVTVDNSANTATVGTTVIALPVAKACTVGGTSIAADADWAITVTNEQVVVTVGTKSITDFANGAS